MTLILISFALLFLATKLFPYKVWDFISFIFVVFVAVFLLMYARDIWEFLETWAKSFDGPISIFFLCVIVVALALVCVIFTIAGAIGFYEYTDEFFSHKVAFVTCILWVLICFGLIVFSFKPKEPEPIVSARPNDHPEIIAVPVVMPIYVFSPVTYKPRCIIRNSSRIFK